MAKQTAPKKPSQPKPPREASAVTTKERHKMVADAILTGASDSDALRAAGYHPSNGKNVIRNEEVQNALAEARKEITDITTIRRLDVINIVLDAVEMARLMADPGNMINGADKLAKIMGYYAPETKRIELTTDQSVFASKLKQLSDRELMDLAEGRLKVIDGEAEVVQ